jgi:CubicO group peptidase (beta-lactamase class C family)
MHLRTPDALVPIPFALPDDPEMLMGGGGLYSTVVDYLRFARMILGAGSLDGVRVLAPETVATMCESHIGDLVAGGWKTQIPMMSNDVALFPGERAGWGLTFLVNRHRTAEGRSPGSVAWAGLANSYYWIDRTAGVAGVFATQILPFFDDGARATFSAFERAVYDSLA